MISLQNGVRVVYAPNFQFTGSWLERLQVNSGVKLEEAGIYPREDWRKPTASELELLTASPDNPKNALVMFNIPQHLRARWWTLAEQESCDAAIEGIEFQKYAREVLEFLEFKRLPLPRECRLEVVITAPGQRSTRTNGAGLLGDHTLLRLVGGVNLSDEDAFVVFLNLDVSNLPGCGPPIVFAQRVRDFFSKSNTYPMTRIRLRPGEGFWAPPCPLIVDRDTLRRTEIDVHLAITTG